MSNNDIKSFSELLTNGHTEKELADFVQDNGTYWQDEFGGWYFANSKDPKTMTALDALRHHFHMKNKADPNELHDYWKNPNTHQTTYFGLKKLDGAFFIDNEDIDTQSVKSTKDDQRAIALHFWLKNNLLLGRIQTWHKLSDIDPALFPKKNDSTQKEKQAIKNAIDRVNTAYFKRYDIKLSFNQNIS